MQQAMLDGGEGGGDGDAHSAIEMSPLGTAGSPASIASLRKQRLRLLPLDDAFAAGQSVAPISFSPASPHLSNANQNNNANDPRFVPSIASPHAALASQPPMLARATMRRRQPSDITHLVSNPYQRPQLANRR
eukprot:GILJ01001833.1.p2 GENE.GILJ01001833.1~~GILJ01001833.1.p2  ORF type:complete len:133 (-),score=21.30 GILJ01001833.1:198-596(-)